MVHAFRCDRCGEFYEGQAYEYDVKKFSPSRNTVDKLGLGEHLCSDCSGEFDTIVRDFFGGGEPDVGDGTDNDW